MVIFTKVPSMERPLFFPQYVSAAPLIAPRPAALPSYIITRTVHAIHIIIKSTVNIILRTAISTPPNAKQLLVYHIRRIFTIYKIK